jgi:hypothetical protein
MSSSRITLDLSLVTLAALVIGYLIYRIARKGISKKYERTSAARVHTSPWNALSAGVDPTEISNESLK